MKYDAPIPLYTPPKPVCLRCNKPIGIDPFLGFSEKGGGYTCWLCNHNRFEAAREDRQGKLNCILVACVSIVAFGYCGYRHLTDPPEQPAQLTTEERIRADRLDKIDTAMEALQNERDELDLPQDDDRDEHNYW